MSMRGKEPTDGHDTDRTRGRTPAHSPVDAFVAGEGPLAAALREMPMYEPPARMAAGFREMLASLPAQAPAFEPPASLEAAVLGEIARQQAAQATRRETVLGEVARGVEPSTALEAELAPATQAWLRERSREAAGDDRRVAAGGSTSPTVGEGARGTLHRGRPGLRWAAGWWRYAGGALAAVLALGIGLRMMLEPGPHEVADSAAIESATIESASKAPQPDAATYAEDGGAMTQAPEAMRRQEFAAPERERATGEAQNRREALASRERQDRGSAMQDRRAGAAAMAPPPAAAPMPAPLPAPAPPAGSAQSLDESIWQLSDDPAARLAGLPGSTRWILLCHPSEQEVAQAWLRRGLDAMNPSRTASRTAGRTGDELRDAVRIETREDIAPGELRIVPDE